MGVKAILEKVYTLSFFVVVKSSLTDFKYEIEKYTIYLKPAVISYFWCLRGAP